MFDTDGRLFLIAEEGCAEGDEQEVPASNASRPQPRANAASAFLNWVSNASIFLLHLERRFDHWLRPPFDAVLRDPIARLTTALINMQRSNEGLKIAEEKRMLQTDPHLMPIENNAVVLENNAVIWREAFPARLRGDVACAPAEIRLSGADGV